MPSTQDTAPLWHMVQTYLAPVACPYMRQSFILPIFNIGRSLDHVLGSGNSYSAFMSRYAILSNRGLVPMPTMTEFSILTFPWPLDRSIQPDQTRPDTFDEEGTGWNRRGWVTFESLSSDFPTLHVDQVSAWKCWVHDLEGLPCLGTQVGIYLTLSEVDIRCPCCITPILVDIRHQIRVGIPRYML